MAKRRREPSPIGTTPTEAGETAYNTVFIDTSLDTHLAMLVSYCDTVSDIKEKITMEHMQCFPKFGKIKIQSLKVKRRGNFYHLPNFMLVRSAFEGIKRNWFLSAETSNFKEFNNDNISSAPDEKGNLHSIEYPRGDGQSILPDDIPKILPPIHVSKNQNIPTADGHSSDMYSDANRISALKMLLSDGNDEANVVSEMTFGLKVDDKTGYNSAEQYLRSGSPPKKKHKRNHGKDGSYGPAFELERSGVHASTKDTISRSEIGSGNSLVGIPESEDAQQRKHNLLEATAALSDVQTDRFQNEVGDVFDKRSQLESAVVKEYKVGSNQSTENHLDSGNRKEDSMLERIINVPEISMVEKHEMFGSDVATVQLEGNASGPSLRTEKRKKKRRGNHTDNYTPHPLHKNTPMVSHEETDQTHMEENQKEFSVNHDPEVMQSKKLGPKDQGEAGGNITESAWLDKQSDARGERGHDSGRKRRSKKSSAKILQETDVKHSNNVTCADVPNLEFNNSKNESILTPSETCQTTEIDARILLANHEPIKVLCGADVTIKEPNLSAKLLDANGTIEAINSCGIKRKKKKKKSIDKYAAKIQDASVIEHCTEKGESMENSVTLRCKSNEQESGLSINNNPEVMQPSKGNSLVCDKPDITPKETISREQLLDTKTVVEPGSFGGSRKKKSFKKFDPPYLEASGLEHTSKEGVNGTSSDEKRRGISFNNGKDVIKKKSLEGSAGYAFEEVDNANGNEENLLPLGQTGRTKQTTEVTGEKITTMEGENLNPADSSYRDLPLDEQEKHVKSSQLDQIHKNQESTGHIDKKEKEEIEKKQLTASKDHERSPIKYQEVGAEDLTASNDKLGMSCNPSEAAKVKLNRASPSSQLAVSEMEVGKEKLKCMPETDLRTDNLVKNFENENEGINFKSYFIPSQQQDKVASSGGVKVSTKSNQKRKADKNKKKHDSPSVSATLIVQKSVVSYENQECENTSVIRHEKLPSNHDQSEVNTKKPSKVSENLEKASSQTDVAGTGTLQKPEETPSAYDSEAIRAATAHLEENNKSLAGSSSKRSNTFTEKRRDKSRQSDVANRITSNKNDGIDLNSSQQKKILLAKSGTMFWDNVSESSGDENGNMNLNASTCTPSDSSSSSGNSVGESELSQKSTRNGSNGVKKTVAGGKNILKSDLSGKKNITMDMLLRSSTSFKKAKRIATQQELEDAESEPVENVPDSQVNP